MQVPVHFYSYFKDLAGCSEVLAEVPSGATVDELLQTLAPRFPKMTAMQKSMLIAVGVEYQNRDYVLRPGDEVSFFPPVQGG